MSDGRQSVDIRDMRKYNFSIAETASSVEEYVLRRKSAVQQVGCDRATGRDSVSLLQVQPNV